MFPELVLIVVDDDGPGGIVASVLPVESGLAKVEAIRGWIISATVAAIYNISSRDNLLDDVVLAGELSPKTTCVQNNWH